MNEQEQKAYVEEKAKELWKKDWVCEFYSLVDCQDFILSIIKDCQPKVRKESENHPFYCKRCEQWMEMEVACPSCTHNFTLGENEGAGVEK